jgi:hypothetical protein
MPQEKTPDVVFKQGESGPVRFTVTDEDTGDAVDLSGSTYTFAIRPKAGSSVLTLQVLHADIDKTQEAVGIIDVPLDASDTNRIGVYEAELKIDNGAISIEKSPTLIIEFEEAIT